MSEAGQIFALLRASSAAELAKRFSNWDAGEQGLRPAGPTSGSPSAPSAPGRSAGGGAAQPGKWAAGPGSAPPPGTPPAGASLSGGTLPGGSLPDGPLPAPMPSGSSVPGVTLPGVTLPKAPVPGTWGGGGETAPPDPVPPALTVTPRAAASFGHLAPPRADIARLLAETLLPELARLAGKPALDARSSAASGLTGLGFAKTADPDAAPADGLASLASGTDPGDPAFATGRMARAGAEVVIGQTGLATADYTDRQRDALPQPGLAGSRGDMGEAKLAESRSQSSLAGPGQAWIEASGATQTKATGSVQVAAFSEAVTALIRSVEAGQSTTVTSGIIFNAAMIPGWPFPSAMVRDGGDAINAKAMLHRLAQALEGMTPQQAAEYMAKIGGGHVFLRKLRQVLKDLDLIDKDEVKGLLFAFLETISTIASGLQAAFRQIAESAALQSAVLHGEDPEDNDRPGRRRLKL